VLKEVRRRVAEANNIPLQERECTHTGDCAGTCPYCESEVRYLERELSKRRRMGKAVAVAGIALSAVTMAGCATSEPVSSDSSNNSRKTPVRDIKSALSWMGAIVVENNDKPDACNPEKNKSKKKKRQENCDTLQLRGIVLDPESRHDTAQKEITFDESLLLDEGEDKQKTGNDEVIVGLVDDQGFQNRIFNGSSTKNNELLLSQFRVLHRPFSWKASSRNGCAASFKSSSLTCRIRVLIPWKSAFSWKKTVPCR